MKKREREGLKKRKMIVRGERKGKNRNMVGEKRESAIERQGRLIGNFQKVKVENNVE